jgi:hypothetical protein
MEAITKSDLRRLADIALRDLESLFRRHPDTGRLYRHRLFAIALCQGAALHFLDGKNGVKDFDVWSSFEPILHGHFRIAAMHRQISATQSSERPSDEPRDPKWRPVSA